MHPYKGIYIITKIFCVHHYSSIRKDICRKYQVKTRLKNSIVLQRAPRNYIVYEILSVYMEKAFEKA